jgi:hypothetical protein
MAELGDGRMFSRENEKRPNPINSKQLASEGGFLT